MTPGLHVGRLRSRPVSRLSQAIAEGDGISFIVEVGRRRERAVGESQGADGLAAITGVNAVRVTSQLPLLHLGRMFDARARPPTPSSSRPTSRCGTRRTRSGSSASCASPSRRTSSARSLLRSRGLPPLGRRGLRRRPARPSCSSCCTTCRPGSSRSRSSATRRRRTSPSSSARASTPCSCRHGGSRRSIPAEPPEV